MSDSSKTVATPVSITSAIIVLLAILGICGWLISSYINGEKERDMLQWQSRLGLVADSKAGLIERWQQQNLDGLLELADNASLQLYLWRQSSNYQPAEKSAVDEPATSDAVSDADATAADRGYLLNMIRANALRLGYSASDGAIIPANVAQGTPTGLLLLNNEVQPVVASVGTPALHGQLKALVTDTLKDNVAKVSNVFVDDTGNTLIAFAVPVKGVLGTDQTVVVPNGVLLGIRSAERELFPLLKEGAAFHEQNETLLVALTDADILYLAPTADGAQAMQRSLPSGRDDLASARHFKDPEFFGVANNYQGAEVLSVSRSIDQQPWLLIQQVAADQALRETNDRQKFLWTSLLLGLLSVLGLAIAAWRHGSSIRARQQAEVLRQQAAALRKQTELLHATTDNIESDTILLGPAGKVIFANLPLLKDFDIDADETGEVFGAPLSVLLGPKLTSILQPDIDECRREGKSVHSLRELDVGDTHGHFQVTTIPIDQVGEHQNPLLIVMNDVSELREAELQNLAMLRNLVNTLVQLVDAHDPYLADHSEHLEDVATVIGEEMKLTADELDALQLAARLSNIGKVRIDMALLTKTGALTEEEHKAMQEHVQHGLDILKELQFDGPVIDIIAQKQELVDGTGYPNGLTSEQMTDGGKVLAVANAFVALVSPRSYREALGIPEAMDHLMQVADSKYDRKVLAALLHATESRRESKEWRRWWS